LLARRLHRGFANPSRAEFYLSDSLIFAASSIGTKSSSTASAIAFYDAYN
jgi:hypothetical protein